MKMKAYDVLELVESAMEYIRAQISMNATVLGLSISTLDRKPTIRIHLHNYEDFIKVAACKFQMYQVNESVHFVATVTENVEVLYVRPDAQLGQVVKGAIRDSVPGS